MHLSFIVRAEADFCWPINRENTFEFLGSSWLVRKVLISINSSESKDVTEDILWLIINRVIS